MKRAQRFLPALALLLAVCACQRERAPGTSSAASTQAASAAVDSQALEGTPNAFNVEVTLSAAARDRLVSRHESLIVAAAYFGYPSAEAEKQGIPGSENPWLTLHRAQIELDGSQLAGTPTARFPRITLDAKQLAWTDAPDAPQVNVNVYSGRRSSPDNLLDCAMFQDTLAIAARAPVRLSCGLIGEAAR